MDSATLPGRTPFQLDGDKVADILTAVHDPAGAAFQSAITDDARDLFRGGAA